jgi:hypothetical protein
MPVTVNEYITTGELDFLNEAIPQGVEIRNPGEASILEQWDTPALNMAMRKAESPSAGEFLGGGISYGVTPPRSQRLEFYDGLQKLNFTFDANFMRCKFYAGKAHMGDMMPIDFLERLGLKLKLSDEIRPGALKSMGSVKQGLLVNHLKVNYEKLMLAYKTDLAARFWSPNSDAPKAWTGFFGMFSQTSASTGTHGGQPKSNPLFRHQLITGITGDTLEDSIMRLELALSDATTGEGGANRICFMGSEVFFIAATLFLGNRTTKGILDRTWATDQAAVRKGALKIGIPTDSFVTANGTLMVREPMFKYLDRLENPAVKYEKSFAMIDWNHLEFISGRHMEYLDRGMPIDQMVRFGSLLGSYVLGSDKPSTIAVGTMA